MKRLTVLLAAWPLLQLAPAWAQAPAASPGATQQRQIEEERRLREQDRLPQRPATDPLRVQPVQPAPVSPAAAAVRFAVREIRFTPSALLSSDELQALAKPYLGPQVSLADLQKLVAEVNQLYRSRGIVTALALIPSQDVSSGVITIRLVEGRLGQVRIEGNVSTQPRYVEERVGLQPGALIDLPVLESALIRFNRTNEVQLAAELKPGSEAGLSDLVVLLNEPPRQQFQVFTDNLGVPSTGTYRAGASYLNRSLLGYRDELSVLLTGAEGMRSAAAVYGFPINTMGGRLSFGYYYADTEIRNGSLAPLDVTGDSVTKVLTLRQPTWVGPAGQLDVVYAAGWSNSGTDISGVPLQLLNTRYQSLGLEGQWLQAQAATFAGYTYTLGDVTSADPRQFGISRVQLRHNRDLPDAWSVWATASGQWSGDVLLPSNQQYYIGGEGSVRGYATGLLSGDEGYTLSVELRRPLPLAVALPDGQAVNASAFVFVDYGRVYPFRPPGSVLPAWQQLTGTGLGLRAALGRQFFGTFTAAYGLNDVPLQPRPYALTFQLSVVF